MKKLHKSKIFWTNLIAALIAILGLITPESLATFGFSNTQFLGSVSFLAAIITIILRTYQTIPTDHITTKIGGRPRRDKKPLSILPSGEFVFSGTDIEGREEVTYTLVSDPTEVSVHINALVTDQNHQSVLFVENIEVTDINDITFHFY